MKKNRKKKYQNKKGIKRIASMLLTGALLLSLLGGCGNPSVGENIVDDNSSTGEGAQALSNGGSQGSDAQSDGTVAMGRYVEEVTDIPDRLGGTNSSLFRLADGSLVIVDYNSAIYVSGDNGATWEEDKSRTWQKSLLEEGSYILVVAMGTDNTTAVIHNKFDDSDSMDDYHPELLIVRPDGTEIPVEFPLTGDEKYVRNVGVADDGTVFATVVGGNNLYEIKEDGSCELFLTIQAERPELIQCQGNYVIMDGYHYDAPLIYDREKKEFVDDEVWEDLVKENYKNGNGYSSNTYEMYFFPGEEGVLYLAGEKGLHRHVIGGNVSEQVIDGSLCTFGNPIYGICGMVMLEDNMFLTLFSGGRIVRYVYDPNAPTVPNNVLKVYSLKENDTIRQAISIYQTANPEVFVNYEVGMENGGSVTRDDALKSLNTEIMAGEGPDVLLLDEMPLDSYIEKGMLQDLSPIVNGFSGEEELFGNIVDAMKTGDSLYALPLEISIPMLAGAERYISQIKDLEDIADVVEQLRMENPEKNLLGICSETGIMRIFAIACLPAWTTENGGVDKAAVSEFLKQTKRIYDAQMDGLIEKEIYNYNNFNDSWMEEYGETREESKYFRHFSGYISYVSGRLYLASGAISSSSDYMGVTSLNRTKGFEDSAWALMNGQSEHTFCAATLVGISAVSEHTELAEDFVKICLGKEAQANLFNGFAINKAAFEASFIVDEGMVGEDGGYLYFGSTDEDGNSYHFTSYVVNDEQIAEFRECIEVAKVPYIKNAVLEEAVYQEGSGYMQGRQSLEDAVDAIDKKLALYLAE